MRVAKNQVRYLAAGGVLLAGVAWAGTVYRTPPTVSGPSPSQLRTLAERLETSTPETAPLLDTVPSTGAPRIIASTVKKPTRISAPRLNAPRLPSASVAAPTPAPAPAAKPPTLAPAPEPKNPVKSIALMGVTNRGDVETAWLVNLDNQERELAEVGGRAFGLTIKDIEPEQVVLTDGDDEYLLHLGEKQIPVTQVAATSTSGMGMDGGFDAGNGEGRRRGRNGGQGFAGFSGRNGGQGFTGFSGRRGGGNWGGSGGWTGGSTASTVSSSISSNSSGFSGRRNGGFSTGSSSFGRSSSGFGRSSGGFSGGGSFSGGGGFGGRGGNSMSTSQFAAGSSGPTSNPQTARRRGGQLTGDTPAQPSPAAISNPQTQRRTGSANGSAFGMQQQGTNSRNSGFGGNFGRTR